jgi:mRNA interferase RelE/StbE
MASYNIIFKPSVEKDLHSLPKSVIARVMKQIETLRKNPFPRQSVKLVGAEQLYRIRVGDYRVVYAVDKEAQEILIHYIRHRREVYRG